MRGKYRSRLWIKLILSVAFAAACAFFILVRVMDLGYYILDHNYMPAVIAGKENEYIRKFQAFVTVNKISMSDGDKIMGFTDQDRKMIMTLYHGDRAIFSSDGRIVATIPDSDYGMMPDHIMDTEPVPVTEGEKYTDPGMEADMEPDREPAGYTVAFSDGAASAVLFYIGSEEDEIVYALSTVLSGLCFVLILYLLIRKKVKYIELLGKEMEILKSGELNYQVTVKGNDELSSLAEELDSMRKAILSRQEEEELLRIANRDMVTAMSHDLRTPLTSLMGYLDILGMEKNGEKQKKYLSVCRDKAAQIKSLSDKLFEYFLVYSRDQDELHRDEVNGAEFVGQIVEESLFDLESEGLQVIRKTGEITCSLSVDVELMRRVFGNLFSNILKYADRGLPVEAEYRETEKELIICLKNSMAADESERESTNIGLKTCGTILERHGGTFRCGKKGRLFKAEVRIPCVKIGEKDGNTGTETF